MRRRLGAWLCRHGQHSIEDLGAVQGSVWLSQGRCQRCSWQGNYESWPESR